MKINASVGAYLAMCEAVEQTIADYPNLQPGSMLHQKWILLRQKNQLLRETEEVRKRLEKYPAQQKKVDKDRIESLRKPLANALLAFATESKNQELIQRAKTYVKITYFRPDRDLKTNFNLLVQDIRAQAAGLEKYNVSEAQITEAETVAENLPTIINQTLLAKGKRVVKTQERDRLLAELRVFFKTSLDPTVLALRDEAFAALYHNLRRVSKRAVHQKDSGEIALSLATT